MKGRGPRSSEPRGDRIRAAREARSWGSPGAPSRLPGGPRRAPRVLSPPRSPSRTPSLRPSGLASPPGPSGWPDRNGSGDAPGGPLPVQGSQSCRDKSGVAAGLRRKGPECRRLVWTGWVQRPSWGRALGLPLAAAWGGQKRATRRVAEPTPHRAPSPTHSPASPRGLLPGPPPRAYLRAPPGLGPRSTRNPRAEGERVSLPRGEGAPAPGLARPRGPRPDAVAFPREPLSRWRRSGPAPPASPRPRPPARVRSARPAGEDALVGPEPKVHPPFPIAAPPPSPAQRPLCSFLQLGRPPPRTLLPPLPAPMTTLQPWASRLF